MDWMTAIQRAADYVEAHLTEDLRYDEIARQGFSSEFHFQRMFGLLCGCTLGEYIRNRRLTLAGAELVRSDLRVIDAHWRPYGERSSWKQNRRIEIRLPIER